MVHEPRLHTVDNTQTPGDGFSEKLRTHISELLSDVLSNAGVHSLVMWGECATLYYGVPMGVNNLHVLVPDDQLEASCDALLSAGYRDEPFEIQEGNGLLDPNIRWEELGPARQFVNDKLHWHKYPLRVLLQNRSAAGATFTSSDPSSFPDRCGGLIVPPLQILAQSFLGALHKLREAGTTSRTQDILSVWISAVKFTRSEERRVGKECRN